MTKKSTRLDSLAQVLASLRGSVVLLDIDGTLVCDQRTDVAPELRRAVMHLKEHNIVYLASNYRKRSARNTEVARTLGVPLIGQTARKPSRLILHEITIPPGTPLVVVGDKVTTDGRFAHAIGARFIKVPRLTCRTDRRHITLIYWFDNLIYALTYWRWR